MIKLKKLKKLKKIKKGKKMNKIILIIITLTFSINGPVLAEETKCKAYQLACKLKKGINNTIEYQKKGIEKSKGQLKGTAENIPKP